MLFRSQDPREFYLAFDGLVRALVRAHDLLTANAWLGASLHDVVSRTLAPLAANESGAQRFTHSGPPVRFESQAAVTLHMGLHELATNATKYGALSTPGGLVSVTWRVDREREPCTVEIVWRETGGPPVVAPSRRGFGSSMLQKGLARELGGNVTLDFAPEGLVCVMRLPVSDKLGPP